MATGKAGRFIKTLLFAILVGLIGAGLVAIVYFFVGPFLTLAWLPEQATDLELDISFSASLFLYGLVLVLPPLLFGLRSGWKGAIAVLVFESISFAILPFVISAWVPSQFGIQEYLDSVGSDIFYQPPGLVMPGTR